MTRNLVAAWILSLAFAGVGNAQGTASSPETDAHYTKAQVKALARKAHSPDQYRILAGYFAGQQQDYLRLAADEKKEWLRMSQNVTGSFAKYPRPVDSARNRYEYYMHKASEAGTIEAKYVHLVDPDAPVDAQLGYPNQ